MESSLSTGNDLPVDDDDATDELIINSIPDEELSPDEYELLAESNEEAPPGMN